MYITSSYCKTNDCLNYTNKFRLSTCRLILFWLFLNSNTCNMTQFDATSQDRVLQSQLTYIFTSQLEALRLIPVQFRNHKISVFYMNIACKITTSLRFSSLSIFYEICTQFAFCWVLSLLSNGWCQVNVSWSLHHRWCNRIMGNESQSQWHKLNDMFMFIR